MDTKRSMMKRVFRVVSIRISAEDHGRQPVAESVQCFGSWDGCDMMEAWRYDSVRMVHTTMSFI